MMKQTTLIVLVGLLCLTSTASTQSSANYTLNWSVIGGGGCEMHSDSYALQSTIGDTAIRTASGNYRFEADYWYRDAGGVGGEPEICGDLNRDGEVTTTDAVIAHEIAAGSHPFDAAADVSGDGQVTSLDALMILKAAAGQIEIC